MSEEWSTWQKYKRLGSWLALTFLKTRDISSLPMGSSSDKPAGAMLQGKQEQTSRKVFLTGSAKACVHALVHHNAIDKPLRWPARAFAISSHQASMKR